MNIISAFGLEKLRYQSWGTILSPKTSLRFECPIWETLNLPIWFSIKDVLIRIKTATIDFVHTCESWTQLKIKLQDVRSHEEKKISLRASSLGHLVHLPALRKGKLSHASMGIPIAKLFCLICSQKSLKPEISLSSKAALFQCLIMLVVRLLFWLNPLYNQ